MPTTTQSTRIVCVDRSTTKTATGTHSHITGVGIGENEAIADAHLTVEAVRRRLDDGERFYTVSPSAGEEQDVAKLDCSCGIKTIRSIHDDKTDDNLDSLRQCRFSQN